MKPATMEMTTSRMTRIATLPLPSPLPESALPNSSPTLPSAPPMLLTAETVLWICANEFQPKDDASNVKGYAIYEIADFDGDIQKFCNRFKISYNPADKSFPNKDNFRAGLESFDQTLRWYAWIPRTYLYVKRKL